MEIRRLFCDPGSISAGWAFFIGNQLVMSGTCASEQKDKGDADAFRRLALILGKFGVLASEPIDEVHIEQLVKRTHQYTHWAVGAIGALLSTTGATVTADVPISSWQRYCGWKKPPKNEKGEQPATTLENVGLKLPALRSLRERKKVASLDELAACALGFYWTGEAVKLRRVK